MGAFRKQKTCIRSQNQNNQQQRYYFRTRSWKLERSWITLVLVLLSCSCQGLVIDFPCCSNFLHVPSAFGPDILKLEKPLKSLPLVIVEPEDACQELDKDLDLVGKVVLIKRGDCNFTEKISRVQEKDAIAAVVYDNNDRERWGTIMSGLEEWASKITIPSVFVSYNTGMALKNFSMALNAAAAAGGGSGRSETSQVLITLNNTGHVKPKTKQIGPIETLATYVVVSLVLLSFSGCIGLLLALCVTCYQRAFRKRALKKLKIQTFKKVPRPDHGALDSRRGIPTSLEHKSPGDSSSAVKTDSLRQQTSSNESSLSSSLFPRRKGLSSSVHSSLMGLDQLLRRGLRLRKTHRKEEDHPPRGEREEEAAATKNTEDRLMMEEEINARSMVNEDTEEQQEQRRKGGGGGDWEEENRTLCSICLDDYEDGDQLRILPCGHSFHDMCIKPWLMEKSELCPLCKSRCFSTPSSSLPSLVMSTSSSSSAGRPVSWSSDNTDGHSVNRSIDTVRALDDFFLFCMNNLSFFALILIGILSSATILGAVAILKPSI